MASYLTLLGTFYVCLAIYLVKTYFARRAHRALPPGPRPLPLIGNLLDMPKSHDWLKFTEWGHTYGEIVSVTMPGQTIILLNSLKAATELLDNRNVIYAARPDLLLTGRIIGWDQLAILSPPFVARFRDMRRQMHQFMGSRDAMIKFRALQTQETYNFIRRVLHDPEHFAEHIRKSAGAIILKIGYGYEVKEGKDDLIEIVEKAVEGFSRTSVPGAFLVEFLPFLRFVPSWFPGAGWKLKTREWREAFNQMVELPYAIAKSGMTEASSSTLNFIQYTLENAKRPENEDHVKAAAASIYAGGADTTVSSIHTFFLIMTLYPEIQKKAQAEIDAVIGSDRLPTLDDWDRLPYVHAVCDELMRWQPVGPLCPGHASSEDDEYKGYFIPKGAVVVANIWAILRDPEMYSDPETFKPERFLSINGSVPEPDPRMAGFGFGRRICPGIHLAEASIFISCAVTLAAFDITKAVENGREITPPMEYFTGTIVHPKPFKCSIKPRSERAAALILAQNTC